MGLRDDVERFREIGEERRQDLSSYIEEGDLSPSDTVRVPIKIVDLPEFVYDKQDRGGVGTTDGELPDEGQPVDVDSDGDGDGEPGEPGDGSGEHPYYEMDPEEFARELDDELGLDLDPKGKQVETEVESSLTQMSRQGPSSTLDVDRLFRRGLQRKLAFSFDEDYVREALKVAGADADAVFRWARDQQIPVGLDWIEAAAASIPDEERDRYESWDAFESEVEQTPVSAQIRREGVDQIPIRSEDERYRYPEIETETEHNVVVVNIRDVSGSMGATKRELVTRTFVPMDWYLQGTYDRAEFLYIAHDSEAWQVDREEFFTMQSSGGTRVSSAYELAADLLEDYPYNSWNRFVFAAGDGENPPDDTTDGVIPIMEEMDTNMQAYTEVRPTGQSRLRRLQKHAQLLRDHFSETSDVVTVTLNDADDVVPAIRQILGDET